MIHSEVSQHIRGGRDAQKGFAHQRRTKKFHDHIFEWRGVRLEGVGGKAGGKEGPETGRWHMDLGRVRLPHRSGVFKGVGGGKLRKSRNKF